MSNSTDSSFTVSLLRSETDLTTTDIRTPPRFPTEVTIGRSQSCDVQIPHRTVSRRHLEVRLDGNHFHIENLSERGTTLVENKALAAHEQVTMSRQEFHVQVGAFLLAVVPAAMTEPFSQRLFDESGSALIDVDDTRRVPVKIGGCPVRIAPIPAKALVVLAQRVGDVVSFDDILEAIDDGYGEYGGGNVNQIVSYIRNGFKEALEEEAVTPEELVDACIDADEARSKKDNWTKLMQYVVQNHYKRGYSLNLRRECVLAKD